MSTSLVLTFQGRQQICCGRGVDVLDLPPVVRVDEVLVTHVIIIQQLVVVHVLEHVTTSG